MAEYDPLVKAVSQKSRVVVARQGGESDAENVDRYRAQMAREVHELRDRVDALLQIVNDLGARVTELENAP